MLKRMFALVLGLMLLSGAALAEGNNLNLVWSESEENDGVRADGLVAAGGWAYLVLDDMQGANAPWLARWQPGMDAPEKMADLPTAETQAADDDWNPSIIQLFTDGAQVWGVSYNGHVTRLVDAAGEPAVERACRLDLASLGTDYGDDREEATLCSLFVQGERLYCLSYRYDQADGSQVYSLSTFDLASGEMLSLEEDTPLRLMTPYNDEQMLAVVLPGGETFDADSGEPAAFCLSVCDLEGAQAQCLLTVEGILVDHLAALCYDETTQTLYYAQEGEVRGLSVQGGEPVVYAYSPQNAYADGFANLGVLKGSVAVMRNYEKVWARELDAQKASAGALTIMGEYGGEAHNAVIQAHPEMAVCLTEDSYTDMDQITAALLSGDNTIDLMCLSYSTAPLDRLIEKGYAADLSGEPALVDLANRLYPSYRDVCLRDGKLYLLPVSAYPQSLGYCIEALEALGLTEDDLPKTYPELFDFCAQFSDRFGAEHPEVSLAADLGLRDLLLGLITDQYVAYQMKTTGSITLDTPLMRKLMSGLEALDFSEWDPSETYGDDVWSHSDVVDEFYGSNRLGLFVSCSVSPSEYASRNAYSRPLLLSLDDGLEPILPAISVRVFFVNPRSARMEQAVQYLTVYLQNLPWETKVAFFEDADDPVPNPYYESSVARVQAYVDDLEKQLAAAAPENRAELEDALQTMQDNLQEMEKDRYDLSREDIARYRQNAAPYIYVLPQTPLTDGDTASNFSQLMQQYRQHAIDLDAYLQEAQRRLRLMQMEGQ